MIMAKAAISFKKRDESAQTSYFEREYNEKKAQKIMVFLASKYDSVVFSGTPQLGMPFRN